MVPSSKLPVALSSRGLETPSSESFEQWEDSFQDKLMRIPFFAQFEKWQPFYIWRAKVRKKKIHLARRSLERRLFIGNQVCDCV